jgi:uncharacterized membrane protein
VTRLGYLDWLRGIAVLIMVEAHVFDAWTRLDGREGLGYRTAMAIGGLGAPLFMFLAGVALALAAGGRMRRGLPPEEVAARARRRGWQIFGLAFLFRLQSWVISGGDPSRTLLKVDILNIMGLSMLAAAVLWGFGRDRRTRALWLGGAGVAVIALTPLVRGAEFLAPLPDQLEWYLREAPGITSFAIFPWAAFLFGGAAIGLLLESARSEAEQRRANLIIAVVGAVLVVGSGLALSLGVGAGTRFWEDSAPSFLWRFGAVVTAVPLAYAWCARFRGRSWLTDFGVSSLFVYWIHVEMAYGVISMPIHRRFSFEQSLAAYVLFTALLYAFVRLKERLTAWNPQAGLRTTSGTSPSR